MLFLLLRLHEVSLTWHWLSSTMTLNTGQKRLIDAADAHSQVNAKQQLGHNLVDIV